MRTRWPLLLLALLTLGPCSAGNVTGRVFLDTNSDGQWQAGEAPVQGVLVSDGASLVSTGADGGYSLDAPDGPQVVFVDNPAQTWPTKGFWRYLEEGAGVADFPLVAQEQSLPFHFAHGTDLHTRPDVGEQMGRYVEALNALPVPVAFVVHTGDLVVDSAAGGVESGRILFKVYQDQMAPLQAPLMNLAGNHEHVSWYKPTFDASEPGVGKGLYREMFGPLHYAFNYAGVRFIALDGTDYLDGKLAYNMPPGCLAWLKAYLARIPVEDRLVLLCHEPLFSLPQKSELEEMLAGRKVIVSLSGHWHTTTRSAFAGAPEIIGGAVSHSWHGNIPVRDAMAYQVLRITGDGFEAGFADWAERYSVTVARPGAFQAISGEVPVKVQILDLAREVESVRLEMGGAALEITALGEEGLYRTAEGLLDITGLVEGFHDLRVTMRGTGEPCVEVQPRLVTSGNVAEFAATGPAILSAVLRNVNAANLVKVNGEQVATTPTDPGAGAAFKVEIPARLLKRLNSIEFASVALDDGNTLDDFTVDRVTLTYEDAKYRDPRTFAGSQATLNSKQPVSPALWIDLTYPAE